MGEIVDLRGRRLSPATAPVLADLSGRRARVLARSGRAVAVVFLLWLVGLTLAGLGILPSSILPFARALGVQGPPSLHVLPAPRPPATSDLAPAKPLSAAPGASRAHSAFRGGHAGVAPGRSATGNVPRRPTPIARTVSPGAASHPGRGKSAASGQTVKQSSPGHTKSPGTAGNSGSPPGQASTVTSPGRSGSASGAARGNGHK